MIYNEIIKKGYLVGSCGLVPAITRVVQPACQLLRSGSIGQSVCIMSTRSSSSKLSSSSILTLKRMAPCGQWISVTVVMAGGGRASTINKENDTLTAICVLTYKLDMHSLTAENRPRLPGMRPKWFVFESPDLRSVSDIALNTSLRNTKRE